MSDVAVALPHAEPRPAPPMRSLFGPIVLVVLGTVFLLVNVGVLGARGVFVTFARFWPAFLILWGVVKLAEHAYARRIGATARGLGFGGVVLILLLVLFGSAASAFHRHAERINWGAIREEINDHDDGPGPFLGRRFEYTETADYDVPAGGMVKVRVNRGSLRVVPSADGRVHARMRKTVIAYDEEDAAAIHARVKPEVLTSAGALVIDASRRSDWAGARLDLELEIPAKAVVDLVAQRGNIDARGREGAVRIESSHGHVTLEDVAGAVDAQLHHSRFEGRDIEGDVRLDGRINETVLSRIAGAVELKGSLHGDIRADKVRGGVRITSSRTDLDVTRLDGDLVMGDGQLRLTAATGPVRVKTHSQDVDVAGVKGDVRVENRNGEVSVAPDLRSPLGNLDVTSRSGPVRISLPAAAGFAVDARTDKGDIESDFELAITRDHGRLQAVGVVNKGGPKVNVLVEHGTIHLRRN